MKYDNILLNKIKEVLDDNLDLAYSVGREINAWNGELEWLDIWGNDEEFFECMYGNDIMECVRAIAFGEYNFNDDYVRINGYGNIESLSQWELDREIYNSTREIAEALLRNYEEIDIPIEIQEIVEEYLKEEEE